MDYHSKCIMHEIRDLANNICLYEKGEEETRHFLVLPVFTDILNNIDKCNISLASNGGGRFNDISERIDVLVHNGNRRVFVTEVKSLVSKEFNFFNVFNDEDIGKVWFAEKNNGTEIGIVHKDKDGTAQLRSYSAILYFSNNYKDEFYPILTNGFFWVLFKKGFYTYYSLKANISEIEFKYLGAPLQDGYKVKNGKGDKEEGEELYPKIQPCLNSVKYITSVFADKDVKLEEIKIKLEEIKDKLEEVKDNKNKNKVEKIIKNIENIKKYHLNKINEKFISFEKFIKELENIYEEAK